MLLAKQSTAATLIIGPILDSTGAEYTGAVIGDISLSKNGATLTALASAATLTHIANGQYTLVLTTGNTDTLGRAQFTCNKSTYQMPPLELMILPATVFDALVTNATNTTGGLATATGAISALAGAISTLTAAQAATGVWQDTTAGDFTVAGSIGKSLFTSGAVPGAAGGLFIAGTNAATTVTTSFTTTFTGNLTGNVASVLGAVGSVTTGVTVTTNNDKTGYSLTQTFPSNFSALSITAGGIVSADVQTIKTQTVTCAGGVTIPAATLASTTNITAGTITTVTTVTNQLTGAAIATAVWTDTTASDFTTALSVGKSVMNGVTLGTGLTVARCTLTDTLTTYTGNTPQTGDSFARIGATGSGLTSLAPSATALSTAVWTAPPTGFLAATFPTTVASTTNITAGTITTVTNLTNAPTAGDFTATMKTSLNAATPAVTVSDKTGFSLASSQSFNNTGQSTNLPSNLSAIRGTSLTETSSGYLANAFMTVFNVPTAYFTAAQVFPPNFSYLEITAVSGHVSVQDVAGRVLGGGSSAFTGVGVLAQNESGAAIPTASQNRQEMDAASVALAAIYARTDVATSTRLAGSSYTAPPTAAAITTAVLTTAMTESYASDGTAMTLAQAMHMLWSLMAERSISSTTLTAKKLDGSTTAMTFTLDSATAPTSQTRST